MNKLSELISKPVISLYDGHHEGIVGNILLDCKRKRALYAVIFDSLEDTPERVLPLQKIYSVGDCVMIKNDKDLELFSNLELSMSAFCNPMLSTAYDTSGKKLGQVTDIILDDKYFIEEITLSNGERCKGCNLACFNESTCIVYRDGDTIKVSSFKPKFTMPKITSPTIVRIMDEPEPQRVPTLPNRAIANYRLLLNRKVTKNISSLNGEIIIRQNSKINHNIIDIARRHGLLRELTQYSI